MPISTIQFNGSNAYSFAPGEFITSREFGILNMDDIAFGAEVFASNASAKLRATMRFINSAGHLLSTSAQTYTPTVLNLWERAVFTWPVPADAVRCELRVEGVTSTILMAQPKAANGTDPGSYGSNWSPQLTFLTPSGIYTGTLTAKQIILSAGEDLSDRLVTLNENQISLQNRISSNVSNIADLTSEQLTLKTTQSDHGQSISILSSNQLSMETTLTDLDGDALKKNVSYAGVKISPTIGFENTASLGGKPITVKLNATEGLAFYSGNSFFGGIKVVENKLNLVSGLISNDPNVKRYAQIGEVDGAHGILFTNTDYKSTPMFGIVSNYSAGQASAGLSIQVDRKTRIYIDPSGGGYWRGQSDVVQMGIGSANCYFSTVSGNRIGVDAGGAYKVVNNTKTYL